MILCSFTVELWSQDIWIIIKSVHAELHKFLWIAKSRPNPKLGGVLLSSITRKRKFPPNQKISPQALRTFLCSMWTPNALHSKLFYVSHEEEIRLKENTNRNFGVQDCDFRGFHILEWCFAKHKGFPRDKDAVFHAFECVLVCPRVLRSNETATCGWRGKHA